MRRDLYLIVNNNYWDISVSNGLPKILDGQSEEQQRAHVAAYLQKGSIPLLENTGNDWLDFFMSKKSFAEIDAQVRQNINDLTETFNYVPSYDITDNTMSLRITRIQLLGAN